MSYLNGEEGRGGTGQLTFLERYFRLETAEVVRVVGGEAEAYHVTVRSIAQQFQLGTPIAANLPWHAISRTRRRSINVVGRVRRLKNRLRLVWLALIVFEELLELDLLQLLLL